MRATAALPQASALNPNPVTFNVSVGCFNLNYLIINEINSTAHPQVRSFNQKTGELVWLQPQSINETSIDLDLT